MSLIWAGPVSNTKSSRDKSVKIFTFAICLTVWQKTTCCWQVISFVLQMDFLPNTTYFSWTVGENLHGYLSLIKTEWSGNFCTHFPPKTPHVDGNFHRHFITSSKNFSPFLVTNSGHVDIFLSQLKNDTLTRRWKFSPTCYYQSKNFSPFLLTNSGHVGGNFHRHFSVAVEKWYAQFSSGHNAMAISHNQCQKITFNSLLYGPFYWIMTINFCIGSSKVIWFKIM